MAARASFADAPEFRVRLTRVHTAPVEMSGANLANTPVAGVPHPDGYMLIAHQSGAISRLSVHDGKMERWASVSELIGLGMPKWSFGPSFADERGLLGLVLHPQFGDAESKFHGVYYIAFTRAPEQGTDGDNTFVVAQVLRETSGKPTVRAAYKELLKIPQPQPNHNGGPLLFGPAIEDARSGIGYLYISVGDGGGMGDEHGKLLDISDPTSFLGNAQDVTTMLGKVLRIDPNYTMSDSVLFMTPMGNLLTQADLGVLPTFEVKDPSIHPPTMIFALGLRNVWGMSLDVPTGRIFAADVGQDSFEEVNILKSGGNYGWRAVEGGTRHDFSTDNVFNQKVFQHIGGMKKVEAPIIHYDRRDVFPSAVIGGHVYHGDDIRWLNGAYVFGDYHGDLFYAKEDDDGVWHKETLVPAGEYGRLHAIMQMGDGELLLSFADDDAHTTYTLYKLVTQGLSGEDVANLHAAVAKAARGTTSAIRKGEAFSAMFSAVVLREGGADVRRTSPDAWIGSRDIARAKAFTALAFSSNENALSTRTIGVMSQSGLWTESPSPLWGIGNSNPKHGVIEFPGGLPLYKDGVLVGGLGVSGDAPDVDEAVAWAAVREVGMAPPTSIINEPFVIREGDPVVSQCIEAGCTKMVQGTLFCRRHVQHISMNFATSRSKRDS